VFTYSKGCETELAVDVLVCGGGSAGVPAAVAAARLGASVLLVEQHGFAGGIITAVQTPCFDGMHDVQTGRIAVAGLALELANRMGLRVRDALPEEVEADLPLRDRGWIGPGSLETHDSALVRGASAVSWPIDPEAFKLAADRLLVESGTSVLYHTRLVDALVADGRIETIIASNKSGVMAIHPKIVIDSTGDADIATWAGAPYEITEQMQPMSMHFRIANVPATLEVQAKCSQVLQDAHARGEIGVYGGPWMRAMASDEFLINGTRYIGNALDPWELTRAEIQGREDVANILGLWRKHIPEFANAYLVASGPSVGARETRRIVGDYTLSLDDIVESTQFDDVVVRGAWFLDRHPSDGHAGPHPHRRVPSYGIPYRTLLPRGVQNAIVAGRCHSATHEALSSSRVTVTAMGMGEAAGTAAAIAVAGKRGPREIDMDKLQAQLKRQNVILH
jgi:glycine/D-amino acid oxidase-like deaminating enzyme